MAATTADLAPDEAASRPLPGAETARAKINLALHVVGRRPDGYHLLDSLVVFADIGDLIEAVPGNQGMIDLTVTGEFASALSRASDDENLVIRAALALRQHFPAGRQPGASLRLTKRLPVAAGLGGGSADAAATLRLLARHWEIDATDQELSEIGLGLGADVPVCLLSRPARMEGIGERVTSVGGVPSLPLVLVNPAVAISTADVFKRLTRAAEPILPPLPRSFRSIDELVAWLHGTRNDLYEPARSLAPLVETAVTRLARDPGCLLARMTGSGSSVFGIFSSAERARSCAERIRREEPGWWVVATETGAS